MIKKIDIAKFGLFKDYLWSKNVGGNGTFTRLNLIYGRNYSGKTTLARIIQCAERGELHKNYLNAEFTITTSNNESINKVNIANFKDTYHIRVYNTDFISKNLSWLHNEDGSIQPFTILGSKNVELEKKNKAIEERLGSVEAKKGLLYDLSQDRSLHADKIKSLEQKSGNLATKLRSKANDKIKVDSNLFLPSREKKVYNIGDIYDDLATIAENADSFILDRNQIIEKKKILPETPLPGIEKIRVTNPNFRKFFADADELLSREIKARNPIAELVNESNLQEWVREGIPLHKGKRKTCGFCTNALPSDLWERFAAHFNKESEDLRRELESKIDVLEAAKQTLENYVSLNKDDFYTGFHKEFNDTMKSWTSATKKYSNNLDNLIKILKVRTQDIFKTRKLREIDDVSDDIGTLINKFNSLIDANNGRTKTLDQEQQENRRDLRLSEVAQFAKDIDYFNKADEVTALRNETEQLTDAIDQKRDEIQKLEEEQRALKAAVKDESKGAELVNQHLSKHFGHDELKLIAEGEPPNVRFKIRRENADARNLSEGESSLISFCYFIAKMEDEMNADSSTEKLIIYIDDPISSLDSNHIFFMFSLIESIIAKPEKFAQLFISTHNLEFFKYLRRLTGAAKKDIASYFMVERLYKQNDKNCILLPMPDHIKNYVTEFNYLFGEIYNVYRDVKGDKKKKFENTYNQLYNFPNNLRKFLECYLFYKFPNSNTPLKNLEKLFENNVPSLINRIINEFSHLTYLDRGWIPMDFHEAEDCAKIVIDKIREKDPDQFAALVESIGEGD